MILDGIEYKAVRTSDFVRVGGGPYLWGQSECKNAECGVDTFDVLLIKGFTLNGQGAWGPYYDLRCPGCGAWVRNLKRRPGARPLKTFPKEVPEEARRSLRRRSGV